MKETNAWDSSRFSEKYFNIDEIESAIKSGDLVDFLIKEKFTPGDKIDNYFETKCDEEGIIVHYTNQDHPLVVSNFSIFVNSVMNPAFFEKHRERIINASIERIKKKIANRVEKQTLYISIPSYLYSEDLLDYLINVPDVSITLYDVKVSQSMIKKMKEKFIDVELITNDKKEKISSRYVFGWYTPEMLKEEKRLILTFNEINEINEDNIKYFNDTTVLEILNQPKNEEDYQKLFNLVNLLDKAGKKNVIKIEVKKRSEFNKVFGKKTFDNINLVVHNDLYDYSHKEYLKEEEKLDNLITPLVGKELSPLEKYMAVYNIVKNYKKYRENKNQLEESRYLRYILDNEYMVCVGYAKLLEVLCERVGVNVVCYGMNVDVSYDDGYTLEDKPVEAAGHERCIISIDDDKYNVHGLYIVDPTWDNALDENRLNHVLMTFDKMQVGKRMVFYSYYTPILDIHNFKEYSDQIKYLVKKRLEASSTGNLLSVYELVIKDILDTINCDSKYDYFIDKLSTIRKEKEYEDFFIELGNYLLTRTNKEISDEVILNAAINSDKIIGKEIDESLTREKYYERKENVFPYEIDSENEHNLLGRRR